MALFRQRRDDLAARVARLRQGERAARASGDQAALTKVRDEATEFQSELVPRADSGDLLAARALMDVARICLFYRLSSRDWLHAVSAGIAFNTAAIKIFHGGGLEPNGVRTLGYPDLPTALLDLAPRLSQIPEAAAYAAHLAGQPLAAVQAIETLTSIVTEMRMSAPGWDKLGKQMAEGTLSHRDLEAYARRREQIIDSTRPVGPGKTTASDLRAWHEKRLPQLAALSVTGSPLEQFPLHHADEHALLAASLSGRTLLYVLAGPTNHGGTAVRLMPGNPGGLAETAFLPGLPSTEVTSRLNAVSNGFKQIMTRRRHAELARDVRSLLEWTGATVWGTMLGTWPDLLSTPLLVVGVAGVGMLPLYTALVNGVPACAQADVVMAPSARSVHLASVLPAAQVAGPVIVAADPWHGIDRLKTVKEEAAAVASVHGVSEVVYDHGTAASPEREQDLRASSRLAGEELKTLLSNASVAHLACHGTAAGPALLIGGNRVYLHELLGRDSTGSTTSFPGRPLIVLSACEVGGYTTDLIPGEHYGFPAGLMAMGARAVIGALWPVPDSQDSVSLMRDFHQRLLQDKSPAALSGAISAAERKGADPIAWGSFTHFGT